MRHQQANGRPSPIPHRHHLAGPPIWRRGWMLTGAPALVRRDDLAAAAAATAPQPALSFSEIYSSPENQVFKVVFFPDRIFHAQYLNASRVPHRYRYAVSDAPASWTPRS